MGVWPLILPLLTLIRQFRSLEIGDSQYLQNTNSFSWVLALIDERNEISCNANLISNFVSLTACECLAFPPIEISAPLVVRNGSHSRYKLLGGSLKRSGDLDPNLIIKPISFHVHDKCSMRIIYGIRKWVYNFGIITHHAFNATVGVRLEAMPTWSRDPFAMEKRFWELAKSGQPCYIVGWTSTAESATRQKVKMYEGFNCTRYACRATREGRGKCSPTAVACTRYSTSKTYWPYCHLEPGMPLICGSTVDTYAITEGAVCVPESMNFMWKVSLVLDWIEHFTVNDDSFFMRNSTIQTGEVTEYTKYFSPLETGGNCQFGAETGLIFLISIYFNIFLIYP